MSGSDLGEFLPLKLHGKIYKQLCPSSIRKESLFDILFLQHVQSDYICVLTFFTPESDHSLLSITSQ